MCRLKLRKKFLNKFLKEKINEDKLIITTILITAYLPLTWFLNFQKSQQRYNNKYSNQNIKILGPFYKN